MGAAHPDTGPRVRNAEELRQLLCATERRRTQESALILNDAPDRQKSQVSATLILSQDTP